MAYAVSLPTSLESGGSRDALDVFIERVQEAESAGVDEVWLSQGLDLDAISLAALAARAVPRIALGTAVVPIYPRHPITLASQAKVAQIVSGGRFALGVGLSNARTVESVFGISFRRAIADLRDHLRALRSLLDEGSAAVRGNTVTADLSNVPGPQRPSGVTPRVPLLVAAMGPQALRATGELADGTLPYLAGPRTLAELIVPTITAAAHAAGRPGPRIAAGVPAVVTRDVDAARERAIGALKGAEQSASYRAVLDREQIAHAGELALIGDEATVAAGLQSYLDAGATDVRVSPAAFGNDEERLRTWRLVGELARDRARSGRAVGS